MCVQIRFGTKADIGPLAQLYDDINDYLANNINYTGWKKGIYPARRDAEDGVREGSLFVAAKDDEMIGSFLLRHRPEPAYLTAAWQAELDYRNVLVIYTFVVKPQCLRRGIGERMLEFAGQYAKNTSVKALRLDVYEKNHPAIRLYEKCGFRYVDTVSLGLENLGLDWFRLYEKLIV